MRSVGVRELKERASEIVRHARERQEAVDVTYRGHVVARLVPVRRAKPRRRDIDAMWSELDHLAAEIDRRWPAGASGARAVSDDRRG